MKQGLKKLIYRIVLFLGILVGVRLAIKIIFSNSQLYQLFKNESVNLLNKTDITTTLIFITIAFLIFKRESLLNIDQYKAKGSSFFFILSLLSFASYYAFRFFTTEYTNIIVGIIRLLLLLAFGGFLFLACFGLEFVKMFRKDLAIFGGIGVAYYFITHYTQYLWAFFATFVAYLLKFIFSLFFDDVFLRIEPNALNIYSGGGPTLGINGFVARIGPPCSGVDSFLLFLSLFILILAVDWKKLKLNIMPYVFIIGAVGVFAVNIIRIFLLYLIGAYVNKDLAVGLFHTNAAWILFIAYFFLFWWAASKFVYKKESIDPEENPEPKTESSMNGQKTQ